MNSTWSPIYRRQPMDCYMQPCFSFPVTPMLHLRMWHCWTWMVLEALLEYRAKTQNYRLSHLPVSPSNRLLLVWPDALCPPVVDWIGARWWCDYASCDRIALRRGSNCVPSFIKSKFRNTNVERTDTRTPISFESAPLGTLTCKNSLTASRRVNMTLLRMVRWIKICHWECLTASY